MKKLLIAFILGISLTGNAQDLTDWQVGINATPFIFTKFSPDFWPEKKGNDYPNGFGIGLTLEKNWNENWGVKTGFEYTKQNEKYIINLRGVDSTRITQNFEYYKIPLTVQYSYSLNENLLLTFNQGVQFSFLKYYKHVEEDDYHIMTSTTDYGEYISYIYPERNQHYNTEGKYYKKTLFGVIGFIGLKYFISNKISLSSNLRYEFDLTDADNYSFYKVEDWKNSHNFRLGLELGLQYHFSINDRFNKSPHKL